MFVVNTATKCELCGKSFATIMQYALKYDSQKIESCVICTECSYYRIGWTFKPVPITLDCATVLFDKVRKMANLSAADIVSSLNRDKAVRHKIVCNAFKVCAYCKKSADLSWCSICMYARYCSEACQKKDWKFHKKNGCTKDTVTMIGVYSREALSNTAKGLFYHQDDKCILKINGREIFSVDRAHLTLLSGARSLLHNPHKSDGAIIGLDGVNYKASLLFEPNVEYTIPKKCVHDTTIKYII